MFERRLKLLLVGLVVMLGVLAVRAAQLQISQHEEWSERARASLKRQQLTETVRGTIFDVKGRVVAQDVACIDACVDYRVIIDPPDETWVRNEARRRLRGVMEGRPRAERVAMVDAEVDRVKRDIEVLWDVLGRLPGSSPQYIAEIRRATVQRVETRRRQVWIRSYAAAMQRFENSPRPAWFKRFLLGEDADVPRLEQFEIEVGEQVSAHPILRNIPAEVNNYLAKNLELLPGLVLRPGITRSYPFGEVGAHLVGQLASVTREDLRADEETDELRQYLPFDQIGRGGLEGMFERELRGRRGRIVRLAGQSEIIETVDSVPGGDARTTIDFELQARIQELFAKARFEVSKGVFEVSPMHGAAVVIDIATGEVRAMASYPSFDPNTLDVNMARLLRDEINLPLLNRATMSALEPGSTVKPMVGLAAIGAGVIGMHETIMCNGYLVLGGRQYTVGRCWTMTRQNTDHRFIPWDDPHETGRLNFVDAVQRSCNIFFETCGDRMGIAKLSEWMLRFGLGRPTGIGIAESRGRVPSQVPTPGYLQRSTSWFAGIGQGKVLATPLQMANMTATIARGGVWVRPTLVPRDGLVVPVRATAGVVDETADVVDLGLSPEAIRLAKEGMVKVVNTRAGSGNVLRRDDMVVAGKTGTAQAAPFTYPRRDADGNLVRDERGRVIRDELRLSTRANPNPLAPWYRGTGQSGTDRAHAWFVGYAPAENPQVAFAVLVEYGGGGGSAAAPIARDIVQACVDTGYLTGRRGRGDTAVGWLSAGESSELLHDLAEAEALPPVVRRR